MTHLKRTLSLLLALIASICLSDRLAAQGSSSGNWSVTESAPSVAPVTYPSSDQNVTVTNNGENAVNMRRQEWQEPREGEEEGKWVDVQEEIAVQPGNSAMTGCDTDQRILVERIGGDSSGTWQSAPANP